MAVMSQALVAKYVLSLRDAQSSFKGFVQLHYPTWTLADFQLELIQAQTLVDLPCLLVVSL